jgi:polysaccharide export outer membrane protein
VAASCLAAVAAGCRSGKIYDARALPPELQARATVEQPPLDLSLLARRSSRSELIYPGDVLDVTVATGVKDRVAPLTARVDQSGQVVVPPIGSVGVARMTLTEAEHAIRAAAVERRIYRDPQVTVLQRDRQTDRVRVVGAVMQPGIYEIPRADNDLLSAIVAAGGLAEAAGTAIDIRHPAGRPGDATEDVGPVAQVSLDVPQARFIHVDLVQTMQGKAEDLRLQDGSVVMVHEREAKHVFVAGLVGKPDAYELPTDRPLRLLDALSVAGGRTLELADKVLIVRQLPGRPAVQIQASVRAAKAGRGNLVLAAGDIVSVEETTLTFAVMTLRNFFRVGFSSGIPGL